MTDWEMNICAICSIEYEGVGNSAAPINTGRCCDACDHALVTPVRVGQVMARGAAREVAEHALLLARRRVALVPSAPPGTVKELALIVAQSLVANAVEREHGLPPAPGG